MKTKKIISLFLSVVMLVSVMITIDFSAYATVNYEQEPNNARYSANSFRVNSSIKGQIDVVYDDWRKDDDEDFFKFELAESRKLQLTFAHEKSDSGKWLVQVYRHIGSGNYELFETANDIYADSGTYIFSKHDFPKGVYYIEVAARDYYGYPVGIEYTISLTEYINKPSTLKVSTRNTTSLKLSWGKVGGVSGYQLQRKSGDSWKTVANTTSANYTVKSLKAGTTYNFRVRAYKTINGTKYYSGWRTLKTPTKPSKPSIKTPSTNKKHQIIAKWKKVSACSGYQVQYSTSSKFKSPTTKTISGASKTSYTAKFKKGKKYYVRVRAYKTVDGKKYYSAWSSVKSIKCK